MSFEDWKEQAANHLEDAGIAYSAALDEKLFELWKQGTRPDQVVGALSPRE
jgi:hypothetical protein